MKWALFAFLAYASLGIALAWGSLWNHAKPYWKLDRGATIYAFFMVCLVSAFTWPRNFILREDEHER